MDLTLSETKKMGEMELQHFSHHHPLLFIQHQSVTDEAAQCFGCEELIDGPSYGCNDYGAVIFVGGRLLRDSFIIVILVNSICTSTVLCFNHPLLQIFLLLCINIHCSSFKTITTRSIAIAPDQCAELPLEINHPYDRRKHPLTLLPKPPTHLHNCSCYLCKIQWEGFVYSCSFCKIELTLDDFFSPQTITNASHEHPWMLLSRQMSFICDFCGTTGDRTPYLCATCNLLVHKNCISLPQNIMITRHHHVISHSYSLTQLDELCRICYEEVDTRYGSYHCSASDCNYIAHVHCATDKAVWDGKSIPEDYDERSMVALDESINWITDVVEQMSFGENTVAVEIKHAYHDHNLRLTFSGEMNDDGQCDGCMRPISTPFYSCEQFLADVYTMDLATNAMIKVAHLNVTFGVFYYRTLWSIQVTSIYCSLSITFQRNAVLVVEMETHGTWHIDARSVVISH
ncbi:hypothetical protein ES332_A03G058700v1 [Gossypium tomentosum]|uniref:Phorbol-ester/DAG-type domain-containing protein n=1 Tax=Gossypium tomentosum TaxID=34277 RepID=A0A5D2R3M5_GOSTO|nr:hypothetical protein ES332_A03G058700v1 [Gossypium tomentosum]